MNDGDATAIGSSSARSPDMVATFAVPHELVGAPLRALWGAPARVYRPKTVQGTRGSSP
jgi:hypothetical protein